MTGSNIQKVVDGSFCIGCGACAVQDQAIRIVDSTLGLPQASLLEMQDIDTDAVCPFAAQLSEDDLTKKLFNDVVHFDERVGRFVGTYVGHVSDNEARERSSSGGMVSWILLRLLERGEIDGVIHVGRAPDGGYRYLVSETATDVIANVKSRYYPVHFESALSSVLGNGRRYAFVGVPCFIKAVRLLSIENQQVRDAVRYCIAIFCGHMKTTAFSEMIAMQHNVPHTSRKYVDFRVKNLSTPANHYGNQVHYVSGDVETTTEPATVSQLHGMDWGLGYFKAPPCDWCDDIAGETADFSCGDAWLPEHVIDPLGTSVMISRNARIDALLQEGGDRGEITLNSVSVDKVYESQAGNYRHRQEGLSVRIADAERKGRWVPTKRFGANSFHVNARRRAIYRHRQRLAQRSHSAFSEAKERGSYISFMLKMLPLEIFYVILNGNVIRGLAKIVVNYGRYFRKGNRQ